MQLVLRKHEDETWLQAALRVAKPFCLESEVEDCYEAYILMGLSQEEAAVEACYEWDLLELVE